MSEIKKYKNIFDSLKSYLNNIDIKFDSFIEDNINYRNNGGKFTFNDHIQAMILSLLSSQMDWKRVYDKKDKLKIIFSNYDKEIIKNTDYKIYVNSIKNLRIANISISTQMLALKNNIKIFENIERKYGSLDTFVTSDSPINIAKKLARREYKLKSMDYALVCEYLRNVGINIIKPDRHIKRICSSRYLNLINSINPEELELMEFFKELEQLIGYKQYEMDFLLWNYCANGFAKVCTKEHPKCDKCIIKIYCSYNRQETTEETKKPVKTYILKKKIKPQIIKYKQSRQISNSEIAQNIDDKMRQLPLGIVLTRQEFQKMFADEKNSYIPTDYCYDRYNKGIDFLNHAHYFLYIKPAQFKYVGSDYKYTGPVYHRPKGEFEKIVGYCQNGTYNLDNLP